MLKREIDQKGGIEWLGSGQSRWGDFLNEDGQKRTLLWKQTHEKESSFQAEGTPGEKPLQKEGPWHI